jgi:hypothetical protein
MEHIKHSTDLKEVVENGKLVFCDHNIDRFEQGKKVILKDGTELQVDVVMYATGYQFNMPFLDQDDNLIEIEQEQSGGRFMYPLYKRMVSIKEPNLTVIGCISGSPIPLAGVDRQIMFSLAILNKWVNLPTKEEMLKECHQEIDTTTKTLGKGLEKVFKFNYVTDNPRKYNNELRHLINKTGVVYFESDIGFDIWKEAEESFLSAMNKGDYLSFKHQDYERLYPDAVKMYNVCPPNSRFF